MNPCLNPDCVTDYRGVMPWLDAEYCSHACRRAHAPRSDREPDPLCARRACGEPADPRLALYGGYCSSACERLDMPAPVEAWAAAMGRAIDGGPIGAVEPDDPVPPPVRAVEPLTPVPAGAETPESPAPLLREAMGGVSVEEAGANLKAHLAEIELTAKPSRVASPLWAPHHRDEAIYVDIERPSRTQPRRWWARLLRRTA